MIEILTLVPIVYRRCNHVIIIALLLLTEAATGGVL